jgi:hypothetical protein
MFRRRPSPLLIHRFAVQPIARLSIAHIIASASHTTPSGDADPSPTVLLFVLMGCPIYLGTLALWLLTGRGPGGWLLEAETGAARHRPRRTAKVGVPPRS